MEDNPSKLPKPSGSASERVSLGGDLSTLPFFNPIYIFLSRGLRYAKEVQFCIPEGTNGTMPAFGNSQIWLC